MKITINDGYKGFLFNKGKFVKMLESGQYFTNKNKQICICKIGNERIQNSNIGDSVIDPHIFQKDSEFSSQTLEMNVKSGEVVIHLVDGIFCEVLLFGKYLFWKEVGEHNFIHIDLSQTELPADFPVCLASDYRVSAYIHKIQVGDKQKALLYFNKKFVRLLEPGTYYFVKGSISVETVFVDSCLLQKDIIGQEILTSDKVSLRINCVCTYRINDYIKVITEIDDYVSQLHIASQLALREFIETRSLDDILSSKKEMSDYFLQKLKEKSEKLYLDIEQAEIKDIILPGEIRDIMNTVLVAEKRAQANVITRREEVASTRSLLNTARLMDENKTLYKLKEMESIERICEKVGNITLNGNSDMLTQLAEVLCGKNNSNK